jgi:2-oxoglutarate ferredoxin oxidoreductase subunit alpha
MNTGQLAQILRARYLVDVESFCKVQGQPLFAGEVAQQIIDRTSEDGRAQR